MTDLQYIALIGLHVYFMLSFVCIIAAKTLWPKVSNYAIVVSSFCFVGLLNVLFGMMT